MKITFLGVGEACDERLANTAVLVEAGAGSERRSVLLDCGFTVPSQYWQHVSEPEDLDALWISHFHGDHFFGVPALLLRFWEMKRTKPLLILGQAGSEALICGAMDLAYPNLRKKFEYPMTFQEVEPDRPVQAAGLRWRFAENGHGQRDLAVRIEGGAHSVFYSGDGLPTDATLELARGCDLIIHEAFRVDEIMAGHGSIVECIEFARNAKGSCLALVHLQRDERRERYQEILDLLADVEDFHAMLPEPGDVLDL